MNLPTMEILDPVGDRSEDGLAMVPRLRYLRGARLGVLDTQWRSFTTLLEKLLPRLRDEFELSDVVMRTGPKGSSSEGSFDDLAKTDTVLNGLAN